MPLARFPEFDPLVSGVSVAIVVLTWTLTSLVSRALDRRGLSNPGFSGWLAVVESTALGAALGITGLLPFFGLAVSGPALKRALQSAADPRAMSPLMGAIVLAAHNLATSAPLSREVLAQAAIAMAVPLVFRRPPVPELPAITVVEQPEAAVETDEALRERFRALREHAQGLERKGWRDRLVVRLLDDWGRTHPNPEATWAETLRASLGATGILVSVRGRSAWAGEVPPEWRTAETLPDPGLATVDRGVAEYAGQRALHAQAAMADGSDVHLFVPVGAAELPVLRGQLSRAAAALATAAMPVVLPVATIGENAVEKAAAGLGSFNIEEADEEAVFVSSLRRKWRADSVAILDASGTPLLNVGKTVDWKVLEEAAFAAGPRHSSEGQAPWLNSARALRNGVGSLAMAPVGDGRWLVVACRAPGSVTHGIFQEVVEAAGELAGDTAVHGRIVDSATFSDRIADGGYMLLTLSAQSGEEQLARRAADALPMGSIVCSRQGVGLMVAVPDERAAQAWRTGETAAALASEAGTDWKSAAVPAA